MWYVVVVLRRLGWVLQSSITCFVCCFFVLFRFIDLFRSSEPCIAVFQVVAFVLSEFLHLSQTRSGHLPISWLVFLLFFETSSRWWVLDSTRQPFWSIFLGFGWQFFLGLWVEIRRAWRHFNFFCVSTQFVMLYVSIFSSASLALLFLYSIQSSNSSS